MQRRKETLSPTAAGRTRKRGYITAGDIELRHPNRWLALTARIAKLWNTFPGQVVESLKLEILKEESVGMIQGWRRRGLEVQGIRAVQS